MRNFFLLLAAALAWGCVTGRAPSGERLEAGFITPPDSVQTAVYWYWISGNISKEGVVKDLESMKRIGINRAFIGNIGLSEAEAPMGPVKLFTDEWWDIVHAALKRAGELDIEIGMFNCPGWSQAGGPWIDAGKAMRYLEASKARVSGGSLVKVALPAPEGEFQDVMVMAFPYDPDETILCSTNSKITSTPSLPGLTALTDGDPNSGITIGGHSSVTIDFSAGEDFTLRSLCIETMHTPTFTKVQLQVPDGANYRTIGTYEINRTRDVVDVGFSPWAPVQIAVPATKGRDFRLLFTEIRPGSGLAEVKLSSALYVERYPEKTLAKMFQEPLPYWHEYQWGKQPEPDMSGLTVNPGEVIDISQYFTDGILEWDAPEGEWTVMRLGMLPTGIQNSPAAPEGSGHEVDKLTSAYLQHHFDSFIGAIMKRIPAEDRRTFRVMVADSYEKGGQNFSDEFISDFTKAYGYDPTPFLPVYFGYVVGSPDISDRFLWDMRRFVADKLSYEHIGGMRKIANSHGLKIWLENYGHWGFPGEFLQYGGQSDEVAGEFWSEGTLGDIENRAASSCAHIYGKQKVWSESFTCGFHSYSRYPATMKPRGDRFFSEGINATLLHLYIAQYENPVPPGMNAPFGNEFNRLNTWFDQMDLFTTYLKRTNYMLQQGLNVADVAYFIGEDAPKMTGVTDPALPEGYQFDYINAEVIIRDMSVKDGYLTLPHGTRYRMLVLPKLETMRPELLEKIGSLVKQGATVYGPAPLRSPSYENFPAADAKIAGTAQEIWGDNYAAFTGTRDYGKGKVMNGISMEEALASVGCGKDLSVPAGIPVLFGHRESDNTHIYFLTNQSDRQLKFDAAFRTTGLAPEWWQPASGEVRRLGNFTQGTETTTVPLELSPYESVFIVFRDKYSGSSSTERGNFPAPALIADISTGWKLDFEAGRRGPEATVEFDRLTDLSQNDDERIKYYSGKITYTKDFHFEGPTTSKVFLYADHITAMAKVWVNGSYAGGMWTPPYRLDISGMLNEGSNEIKIEVANTWVNRLIGDTTLPANERETYSPTNPYHPGTELQRSGLIGNVTIGSIDY